MELLTSSPDHHILHVNCFHFNHLPPQNILNESRQKYQFSYLQHYLQPED